MTYAPTPPIFSLDHSHAPRSLPEPQPQLVLQRWSLQWLEWPMLLLWTYCPVAVAGVNAFVRDGGTGDAVINSQTRPDEAFEIDLSQFLTPICENY